VISINGAVSGALSTLAFEPSRQRFNDPDGNQVVISTIYARLQRAPGLTTISASLPDNTELIHHKPWVWLAYETTTTGRKRLFTVSSDPATYRYADLRPVSGGTQ
jgi:hypothetical protein